jgi:hypothetical protein
MWCVTLCTALFLALPPPLSFVWSVALFLGSWLLLSIVVSALFFGCVYSCRLCGGEQTDAAAAATHPALATATTAAAGGAGAVAPLALHTANTLSLAALSAASGDYQALPTLLDAATTTNVSKGTAATTTSTAGPASTSALAAGAGAHSASLHFALSNTGADLEKSATAALPAAAAATSAAERPLQPLPLPLGPISTSGVSLLAAELQVDAGIDGALVFVFVCWCVSQIRRCK